jgi:steroid Delta-isomerase
MHHKEQGSDTFLADCGRIHRDWHACITSRDTDGLVALYAEDAIFESPLVAAVLDKADGVLRGRAELRHFFADGTRSWPSDLLRWYRTGEWLTDGHRLLVWEYPRQAPDGDQVDLVEVMEIADGLIQRHRVYWGWKGFGLIAPAFARRAAGE